MKKLCVVFGGASSEHDVSIITGLQLVKNLKEKYEVEAIYLSLDNRFYLANNVSMPYFKDKQNINLKEVILSNGAVYRKKFFKKLFDIEAVINCCHGGVGENGDLAGFFEVNNIKYSSASSLASHIAMDKALTKLQVQDKVRVVKGVEVTKENYEEAIEEIKKDLSNELIVKPNSLGSSIGVKACNKEDFISQIDAIFEMNDSALVENRITNMIELNQACIRGKDGLILSAIEEPLTKHEFLTFDDKYKHGKTKGNDRIIPANISPDLENEIIESTTYIYKKLNLNGVVRIDYIYDQDSNLLYFNEVNTIPGSLSFYLFEPVGIDYLTLAETLIENSTTPHQYSYFNTNILEKDILN